MRLLCRQPPCRLAPSPSFSVLARSRTWSSTFAGSRANPPHSEDVSYSAPRRGIEPGHRAQHGRAVSRTAMRSGTPAGLSFKRLDQESDLDLDLRRVLCDPLHHRDVQYPDPESNLDQGLRSALCDPLHHRDNHQTRADDWIRTSIMRFTKPPPRCSATSAISRSARSRTPLGGFGGRFLSQEDTPVSAPGLGGRGPLGVTTTLAASRSSTLR